MAPATFGLKPIRFIMGMVKAPVATVLATDDPEMEPNRAEVTVAILAGPPRQRPVRAVASSMKNWPAPLDSKNAPKIMKGKTKSGKGISNDSPQGFLSRKGELQDAFDGYTVMGEFARQIGTEVKLGQKYNGQNGQGRAQSPAGPFPES